MSQASCGCSAERVAVVVMIAGLVLCAGAWLQPQRSNAESGTSYTSETAPSPLAPEVMRPGTSDLVLSEPFHPTPSGDSNAARGGETTEWRSAQPSDHLLFESAINTVKTRISLKDDSLRQINVFDEVIEGGYAADFDGDGILDGKDMLEYSDAFDLGDDRADLNGDGAIDSDDYAMFAEHFETGFRHPNVVSVQLSYSTNFQVHDQGGKSQPVRARILLLEGQTGSITVNGETITITADPDASSK